MGLYQRSNGVFYLSLTINNKRIIKSLQTKNKTLADELYSIFLKETFLHSTLSEILPRIKPQETKSIKEEKSKNFHSHYLSYVEYCKTNDQSVRTLDGKLWTLKMLKEHKILTYQDINSNKLDKFWQWCKT